MNKIDRITRKGLLPIIAALLALFSLDLLTSGLDYFLQDDSHKIAPLLASPLIMIFALSFGLSAKSFGGPSIS